MTTPVERAIARLAAPRALLAQLKNGSDFGVFTNGDRRRRPAMRLSAEQARELEAAGALTRQGEGFVLSDAGRARAMREAAAHSEGYLAQHEPLASRSVADADGEIRIVRARAPSPMLRRLSQLSDGTGAPWLSGLELAAARQIRNDWEAAQAGVMRGSDFSAPPMGSTVRRAGEAIEAAMAERCDARRRTAEALDALAPALRRAVERVCLREDGLEALERAEGWPARSGKVALKLALSQVALRLRG